MKLDHVAMYVNNLEDTKNFFIEFFGVMPNEKYHNPKTGLETYFLTFESGATLEIMTRPELDSLEKSLMQTGYVHLAFSVGGKEMVDKVTNKLGQAGYKILSGPRITGDGYYESCILGPEGNQIELTE